MEDSLDYYRGKIMRVKGGGTEATNRDTVIHPNIDKEDRNYGSENICIDIGGDHREPAI